MKKKGKRVMKRTREEKGITLIALIITIVVLMILAAVAINSITNDGIMEHAGSTANTYNQAVANEQSSLLDYEDMLTAANGGYKDKNFNVGDLVTVAGENFYVIEDKTSLGKVVLLAQKNIEPDKTKTATYLTQTDTASTIAFSATNYWADAEGNVLFKDLTENGVPDESHYAARAAYDYGVKMGGKGRLMTFEEGSRLHEGSSEILYETNFWLSYTEYSGYVSAAARVAEDIELITVCLWDGSENMIGVRPVIEISKSKVTVVSE